MRKQAKRAQEMTCACDQVSSQMKCMGCGYSNGEWAKGLVVAAAQMSVVVTACMSSQPVRQKRPMRVTEVKTKWSARRTCAVSAQWGRVLWRGLVTLCNCTKVASSRPIIRVMTV